MWVWLSKYLSAFWTNNATTGAATLAAALALAACGGGGTGTVTNPVDQRSFADGTATLSSRILEAKTLNEAVTFRAETVGLDHTFSEDRVPTGTEFAEPQDVTVRIFQPSDVLGTPPTVVLTLDGGEGITFTAEHARDGEGTAPGTANYRIPDESGGTTRWFWTWDGYPVSHALGFDWNDFLEGRSSPQRRRHHVAFGTYHGEGVDSRRFAVIGLRTKPEDMPTDLRATFEGQSRIDTFPAGAGERTGRYGSDIRLTADFTDGTISGTLDGWRDRVNDEWVNLDPGMVYEIPETEIDGSGFTGTLAPAEGCAGCLEVTSSTVNGGFYGPSAIESGGTIQGEFVRNGVEEVGIGIFYSNR